MIKSLFSRPTLTRLTMAALVGAQVLGWIPFARAETAPAVDPVPVRPPGSHRVIRRALREFDRFLDHHPLLEDRLRVEPRLASDRNFLTRNPELDDFLRANPAVGPGLANYPRYFLNRALLRQANAPLTFPDLAPFKELFQQEPGLEQALNKNPELIRDPAFRRSHADLSTFLAEHPTLARVFVASADAP